MTDQGTTFYMQTSSASGADFSLQYENTWGYLGDHQGAHLGTWSHSDASGAQDDGGSGYKVIAVDESDIQLAKTYASTISNASDADGLVQYNAEYDKVASATTLDQLDAAYQSYQTDNDFSDFTGYYRVRNVNTEVNSYLSSENIQVSTNGSLLENGRLTLIWTAISHEPLIPTILVRSSGNLPAMPMALTLWSMPTPDAKLAISRQKPASFRW